MTNRTPLNADERSRYARHLILPEVGIEGQERLKTSSVLVVGLGGLGSPVAWYLAGAGVGRIGLVDFDEVDTSNLQRQTLHLHTDIGRKKTVSAAEKLRSYNPYIEIVEHDVHLSAENALDLIREYDVVADGTDNFTTRYLVNDACVMLGKPNAYASIFRFEGQASVFAAPGGPCYRCLYPEPPAPGSVPSCAEVGVLGVLPGILGAIQGNEVLKLLLGMGEPLVGRLLSFDALKAEARYFEVERDPSCPVCGERPTIRTLQDTILSYSPTPPQGVTRVQTVPPRAVQERIAVGALLLAVREPEELLVSKLEPCHHIPIGEIPQRVGELDPNRETIVLCRAGLRSEEVAKYLMRRGFKRVYNVEGGINAYAREVDSSLPEY